MPQDPVLDVATKLQTAGVGTLGSSIFVGPIRGVSAAVPIAAVFIVGTGGPRAERTLGRTTEIRRPTVQVMIRAADHAAGLTKARAVRAALHNATISGYGDVEALQPDPIYVGLDSQEHELFSINFMLFYQP
jgi:hypothetical protein